MVICISPAKTFSKVNHPPQTVPVFHNDAKRLVRKLKAFQPDELMQMMHISNAIAHDVHAFYQAFGDIKSSAIHLYDGQAFKGFDAGSLSETQLLAMNDHLYILSGLYGLLRPLDGISKYRLEMKSRIIGNLEQYWKPKIHRYIEKNHPNDIIFNLASDEYGTLLQGLKNLHTIHLEIHENSELVHNTAGIKKARGTFARQMLLHQFDTIEKLRSHEIDGFIYHEKYSSETTSVFIQSINIEKKVTNR